ncbi:hypothetical protein GCM10025787_32580 [Saccharopolyspora rosea]|uniref:DUF11 domain-containing protein n=1 Tax=Saccharopolyspora rosea TaxID=524884 RepID=A0ABW3FYT5_9PSEU
MRFSSVMPALALVLLTPLLASAYVPRGLPVGTSTAHSASVGAISLPGLASVARLDVPRDARIVAAELSWRGDVPAWCRYVPGTGQPELPAANLTVGSERVAAERITRDERGYTAHADVTDRLPGVLAAGGGAIVVRGLRSGVGHACGGKWTLDVRWETARPALSVRTEAEPPAARPGEAVTQKAVVTNSGDVPLTGIVVELAAGACRRPVDRLDPGLNVAVSCDGVTTPPDGRLVARVHGRSPDGEDVAAEASGRIRLLPPPRAAVALEVGEIRQAPGARYAEVPVTVRNISPVALDGVVVSGEPPACRREFGRLDPWREVSYRCRVGAGRSVDLAVTAFPVVGGAVRDTAHAVRAAAHASAPPPAPPQVRPAPRQERSEPTAVREQPERTAAIIAILGVLVMTVSVGALSSATRVGR